MKLILDNGTEINVTLSEEEIAKLCKKKEDVMWFPENGERAWYIDEVSVESSTYWSNGNVYDLFKHKLGLIFKTKQEAEKHLALIEAKYAVRKRIAELNNGWKPDWDNSDQLKYYVTIKGYTLILTYLFESKHQPNWMYIKSKELVNQLISELGPELRLILEE